MGKKTPFKLGKLEGLKVARQIAQENGAPKKVVDKIRKAHDKLLVG